jgi:hypothetical protein
METSNATLIINIEHPTDQSPTPILEEVLRPFILDINEAVADDWSITYHGLDEVNKIFTGIDPNTEEGQEIGRALISSIRDHFKFTGVTWCREDAERDANRRLTDEEWDAVYRTADWQSLSDCNDVDWMAVGNAVNEVIGVPVINADEEPF